MPAETSFQKSLPASWPSDWASARNVLCIRLDALGDVLMTGPALEALACSQPGRRVTLLTSPAGALAGRLLPGVTEILPCEAPWMKASRPVGAEALRQMIDRIAENRFDAAVIFTVYSQNPLPAALLCQLAGIPLRLAHCRENPYQLLTHWIAEPEPERILRHEVRRQLDLVESVGARQASVPYRLRLPPYALEKTRELLRQLDLPPGTPWAVLHPGASAASRRYPAEKFAEVVQTLSARHGWALLITGDASERALGEALAAAGGPRVRSLAGSLDLDALAALLASAPLLISNNTGPVHLASALGTPVVDLYALTNPQHGPWQVPHRLLFEDVPCRYCYKSVCPTGHHRCLSSVPPESVVRAALDLLQSSGKETPPCSPWESTPPSMTAPPASFATAS